MKTKLFTLLSLLIIVVMPSFAKKESKLPDTYAFTRGVEAYQDGKNQDALDWFNKEISEHPDNGYAYIYISLLRYGNDEYGRALSAINQAIKKLPKKDKEYTAVAYGTRAGIYLTMEDTISALRDYDMAVKLEPKNKKHYDRRAQVYFEQGKYDLADADYQQMIILDQGDVMGYMGIGRNANAQERWDDAINQFDFVIKLEPDYSSGYAFRADAYIGKKMWNEATDDIIKALNIDGDDKAFYLMQTLPKEASDLLKSKLKIQMTKQSTNMYWPYFLAVLANSNNDYDESISYYKKANTLDANSLFLKNIAQCYVSKGDYINALDYAERALAMSSEDYDVVDLKADILSLLGRYKECLIERDRCVTQYPDNPFAYLSRADDLLSARRFNEAIEDYNTALF